MFSLALGLALVQGATFRTDTTIAVEPGTRLTLELMAGEVVVRTWDRNQVRLRARHSTRTSMDFHNDGRVLRIEAESRMGMPGHVEVDLMVPSGMPIDLEAMELDVDAEGMRGALTVEVMDGNLTVRDGGDLSLESMNGTTTVTGARGRIALSVVSGDIVASGLEGEVTAESVSGDIWLRRTESSRVTAETVSGRVVFEGAVQDRGSYSLATHSGSIVFGLPVGANATVTTSLTSGRLTASFALPTSDTRSRRRQELRFGTGSAEVELESFNGSVRLVRPGEVPTRAERQPRRDDRGRDRDKERKDDRGFEELEELLDGLQLDIGVDVAIAMDFARLGRLKHDLMLDPLPGLRDEMLQGLKLKFRTDPGLDLRIRVPPFTFNPMER